MLPCFVPNCDFFATWVTYFLDAMGKILDKKYLPITIRPLLRSSTHGLTNHIHFEKRGVFLLLSVRTLRVRSKGGETVGTMEKDRPLDDVIARYCGIRRSLFSICFGINDCDYEIFGISMKKVFVLLAILFLGSGYAACSKVAENIRADYASGMFEAFVTQSYGKSTIAFYQFDVAREKAKKAGENPLKIIAIERLFSWYRLYATSLNLYNKRPTGTDCIRGEYRPYSITHPYGRAYESEWGNNPEQARLVREFMCGVGEIVAAVFCITVGNVVFGAVGFCSAADGASRIFSSLNSLWTNHQTALQAFQEWEKNSLKPAVSN